MSAVLRVIHAVGLGRQSSAAVAVEDAAPGVSVSRRTWAFLAIVGLLLFYYAAVFLLHGGESEQDVALDTSGFVAAGEDRVDLALQVTDLDPSQRVMTMEIQPIPQGAFATTGGSELSEPMILRVTSPRRPPMTFDFDADEVLDSVVVPLSLTTGAYNYPFDRPDGEARFTMLTKDGSTVVPLDVSLANSANDWRLSGSLASNSGTVVLDTEAKRDVLVSSLAIFYLFAIGLTAIISVAVIGASLTDGEVSFSEVIWLGAMLVAIPAIRNEMPGAPAIGTAVDVFVFFPAVGIVALTLLAATVVLALSKHMNRGMSLEEDEDA